MLHILGGAPLMRDVGHLAREQAQKNHSYEFWRPGRSHRYDGLREPEEQSRAWLVA